MSSILNVAFLFFPPLHPLLNSLQRFKQINCVENLVSQMCNHTIIICFLQLGQRQSKWKQITCNFIVPKALSKLIKSWLMDNLFLLQCHFN